MAEQSEFNLSSVLRILPQAAFCVRGNTVCFANDAAQQLMVCDGAAITEYLDTDISLDNLQDDAAMTLPLRLCGHTHSATCVRRGGLTLFVAETTQTPAVQPSTLLTLSQNIRTPLTSLFTASSALFPMLEELENPELQRQMSLMNRAMYQLLRLSGNLSDMRALLLDELKLQREKVEIISYFYALFEQLTLLCREAHVQLHYSVPQKTFSGWLDCRRVEQAVLQLFSNAIKFTPAGGTIDARLTRSGDKLVLALNDGGESMDDGMLCAAFTRYERENPLGDPRCGVGFGLPIVRHIAQLHGGALVLSAQNGGMRACMSLSTRAPKPSEDTLHSPVAAMDDAGGYRRELIGLADVLPPEAFDSCAIN